MEMSPFVTVVSSTSIMGASVAAPPDPTRAVREPSAQKVRRNLTHQPIVASVAANIGSEGSEAVAVSQQDAIIDQQVTGAAEATSEQSSDIEQ